MAEERNLGLARAPEDADPDLTKAELQRRMDEARESITQTVSEIKETVVNQYQQVRESISDTLDWREQYKRHTVPFTVGAVVGGVILGYAVGGSVFGGDDDEDYEDEDYDTESDLAPVRAYAAAPIIGRPSSAASAMRRSADAEVAGVAGSFAQPAGATDVGPDARQSYGGGVPESQALVPVEHEEPKGPGLYERFKETKAYDRLQQEVYNLGDRAVEELSKTARTVVLPALLNKIKDMIGIDLSTQREVATRAKVEQQTERATAATASTANAAGGAPNAGSNV